MPPSSASMITDLTEAVIPRWNARSLTTSLSPITCEVVPTDGNLQRSRYCHQDLSVMTAGHRQWKSQVSDHGASVVEFSRMLGT